MPVKISDVQNGSICAKKGLRAGDTLVSINGSEINDVLDYRFYADDAKLKLEYVNSAGKTKRVSVKNAESCDALGLRFETYLMDKHKSCKNKCIFCFIDQLPKGMRSSLYFKDDDSRLSFLFGNYITLTNLSEHDVERIIKMRIEPVNVSVHTMNPELRIKMMANPQAGESLGMLKRFSDAGITINAQLVLCPGINDGTELVSSMQKLSELTSVASVAAVPAGLTKYRQGLFPLRKFTADEAAAVIDAVDDFNAELVKCGKEKLVYPSDEFFQLAGRELPGEDYYGSYPQLDNGVGLLTLTASTFLHTLELENPDDKERCFSLATGTAAFGLIRKLVQAFGEKYPKSRIKVYEIKNRFFGEDVTVAGLVTGGDLIVQLRESGFTGGKLLLPSVMFRSAEETVFLDDVSLTDVEKELNADVTVTDCDGAALLDVFLSL